MKLTIFCIILILSITSVKSKEFSYIDIQSYVLAENSKSNDYAMNLKRKLYAYETANELIHDSDAPLEPKLMYVTKASQNHNSPLANSVLLPVLSMIAGLFFWRLHEQRLQKRQSNLQD